MEIQCSISCTIYEVVRYYLKLKCDKLRRHIVHLRASTGKKLRHSYYFNSEDKIVS